MITINNIRDKLDNYKYSCIVHDSILAELRHETNLHITARYFSWLCRYFPEFFKVKGSQYTSLFRILSDGSQQDIRLQALMIYFKTYYPEHCDFTL